MSRRLGALGLLVVAACSHEAPRTEAAPSRARIGVLAPAGAEILAALGLESEIVAVGDFVTRPASLRGREKLGTFEAPSLERLVALRITDLVTVTSAAAASERDQLEALGIHVMALDTESYEGLLGAIETLGARFGRPTEARALVTQLRATMDAIARDAQGLPNVRVLVVVGREPLYVAGPGSLVDTMVRTAGGENVAASAGAPYAMLSFETALAGMPEVIIDTSDNASGAERGRRLGRWADYPFLPAVRAERVYLVDPELLSIPGPRLGEMTRLVAKMLHPERFGEPSRAELGAAPKEAK